MLLRDKDILRAAEFSANRVYRYSLGRAWSTGLPHLVVIGLNPSTADEKRDDPTIRRCVGFARKFGYGGVRVVNLFAYRSTEPGALRQAADPVGPDNFTAIRKAVEDCLCRSAGPGRTVPSRVLCAWGNHGVYRDQDQAVMEWLKDLDVEKVCLGVTKHGSPKHPLYLPGGITPLPYHGRTVPGQSR